MKSKTLTKKINRVLAQVLTTVALMVGQGVWAASPWSVNYTGGKFVVTRSNNSGVAVVKYHTVSASALEGKHFTGVNGRLTFADGESSKEVSVAEKSFTDVPLRYRYQGTNNLYYDFEVTDEFGGSLAKMRKTISSGDTYNNQYYLKNITDFVNQGSIDRLTYIYSGNLDGSGYFHYDQYYTPPTSDVEQSGTLKGYVLIDDSYDYSKKSATISPGYLFGMNRAGATGEWHKLVGNKLYASVVFTEKEQNDGYAYVQILIGDGNTAYDTGYNPDGAVNNPVNSIYKACFELQKGSGVYSGNGKWIFPHSYDYHQRSEETGLDKKTAFWLDASYLWQQKFRSNDYRDGHFNNAFLLDPDVSALTVRFDCGGKDNDTYGYKDLFVRWALSDNTAPTVLKSEIVVSSGLHAKGQQVTVSIPFSEPVKFKDSNYYVLHTSWGDFKAESDCDASNVVSFTGTITANAGTALTLNSIEPVCKYSGGNTYPLRDLVENDFAGDVSKSFDLTVGEIYKITYNLKGGVENSNPTQYSNQSDDITLVNPTREHFVFAGWTGTGLEGPTMTVVIPKGSTGARSYTATWAPSVEGYWTGDGSEANPYVISTANGLDHLAIIVNAGHSFENTYFELGGDIDLSSISPFRGIGTYENYFSGNIDGKGHCVSNFTVNVDNLRYSGFIRYLRQGNVRNLVVKNATINGKNSMAVIAGYVYADPSKSRPEISGCSVIDCTINADSYPEAYVYSGAIAGEIGRSSISGCVVNNCSISASDVKELRIGGLAGYISTCTVSNNVIAGCTINGTATKELRNGTIAGKIYVTSPANSFVLNTSINGETILFGEQSDGCWPKDNHYHSVTCADNAPVSDVFTVTTGSHVTASATATVSYSGTDYYAAGTEIALTHTGRTGYDFGGFATTAGTLDGSTLTMPAEDVTVSAVWTPWETLSLTANQVNDNYWTTFYCGNAGYKIDDEENACAYTATLSNTTLTLHLLGKVIPAGTAVVIVGTDNSISMTKRTIAGESPVGNVLRGVDEPTATSALGEGSFHVLGNQNSHFGFHQYTGTTMPARKAYLQLSNSAAHNLTMGFEEDATGVNEVKVVNGVNGDSWYTLEGRKLQGMPNAKGLYIVNGKKVVIK